MAKTSSLVLVGNEIKVRLQAERAASSGAVHVDWLRFTIRLRNIHDIEAAEIYTGRAHLNPYKNIWDSDFRTDLLRSILIDLPDCDKTQATYAQSIAHQVADALGSGFYVGSELLKGQDFYKARWPIIREGKEVAWVGFGASSDSPRQRKQAETIHCNIFGSACTFAAHGWRERVSVIIRAYEADITRIDYALDFFEGIRGGLTRVKDDYESGKMDVSYNRPKCNWLGDWSHGRGRSFYVGSKQSGKQTNIYEKGHQLFGNDSGDKWARIELRYGNKLRVLPIESLLAPDDYFSSASSWHAAMLKEADSDINAEQKRFQKKNRLEDKTVDSAASRVWRWLLNTAAPAIAAVFRNSGNEFLELVTTTKLPKRLEGYSDSERKQAFQRIFSAQACPA